MVILVCNDDGSRSEGVLTLIKYLEPLGEVVAVVPDRERSAAGHSLTLHRPLRLDEVRPRFFVVDGTPIDCVTLAVCSLLSEPPGLLVSGINKGANLGRDIAYSGTVSAAIKGTLLNIPSLSISLAGGETYRFDTAGEIAQKIARLVMKNGLPPETLLNVNVPNIPLPMVKGVKVTRQGLRKYRDVVVEKTDPRGRKYFWIGGDELAGREEEGSDYQVLASGYVSVTPLHLDLTNHSCLTEISGWELWPRQSRD